MHYVLLSSGKTFKATSEISLLDAAAKSGISLPYSCKTGRCSACRCKVLRGETRVLHAEAGLSEQEKSEGWILSCVRSAETDIRLDVEDLDGLKLPVAKTWPCRISKLNHLASDVVQVFLRLPPTADFNFIPGQYVDIIGPNGVRRSYSLANASFANKLLELHIRAVENGVMSEYWFKHAKQNDLLRLNGPLGTFFLRQITGIDLIFLATGTGIAPVKAMLESINDLPADKMPKTVSVLWGGRYLKDLYLSASNMPSMCAYIPVLSRAADDWTGARGYVQDALVNTQLDLSNAAVYACGSDDMIHCAKVSLVKAGLLTKNFYSDAFVTSGAN